MSTGPVPILPSNRWPWLVLLLVAGFLALTAWSFHRAARGASAIIDSDYYNHGLRFERTRLEQQAAIALGWETETVLAGRQLHVTLLDRSRQPVTAARATLTLTSSRRGEPLLLTMTEAPAGTYAAQLPATLHGEQTAQVDFECNGARLGKRLLISLP